MLYSNSENIIVKSVLAIGSLSELQKIQRSWLTFSNSDLWFSLPDEFCQDAIVGQSRIKGFKLQNIFRSKDVKIKDINTESRRNPITKLGFVSSIFLKNGFQMSLLLQRAAGVRVCCLCSTRTTALESVNTFLNKFLTLKRGASMDSETLCLSQFKMQKVLKIRLGFIGFLESSLPRKRFRIDFKND